MTSSCGIRQWAGLITEPRLSVALFPPTRLPWQRPLSVAVTQNEHERTPTHSVVVLKDAKKKKKEKELPALRFTVPVVLGGGFELVFCGPFFHVQSDCELS